MLNPLIGVGWGEIGTHTGGHNSLGYGLDFLGNFMDHFPTSAANASWHALAEVSNESND